MSQSISERITSGRLLARNTLFNLIGQAVPLLVALFAFPLLIKGLGIERFGILTMAWMVIGYFSLFDLGLGRALTKLVSDKLAAGKQQEVPSLVWTTILVMLILGLLGTLVVALLSPWLVTTILKIPEPLQNETLYVFYLMAMTIPIVISTSGLSGLLEAHQYFGLINLVRIPLGILTFAGPVLVLPFSKNLLPVVIVLAIGRCLAWLIFVFICVFKLGHFRGPFVLKISTIKPLIRFGSWMTVSNIVSPVMVYLDRLLIGILISLNVVAYYVTPYEMIMKLLIIPGAVIGVLFPAFSASFVQNQDKTLKFFRTGIKSVFLILFPLTFLVVTFSSEGLNYWLGTDFAHRSTPVLQLLSVGVLINGVAQVPFALLQGIGRPDLTAKLHLLELPFYLILVWWLIEHYGIVGAAIAWVVRVLVDLIFLLVLVRRCLPRVTLLLTKMLLIIAPTLFILIASTVLHNIIIKCVFVLIICFVYISFAWFLMLSKEVRDLLRHSINRFKNNG